MRGYFLVDEAIVSNKKEFDDWIDLCLQFNKEAKASKKIKKAKT
jgi:hypothetical protein